MKLIFKSIKDENGAALVTALLFLVMLTMLGLYSIWTASTETMLGGNEKWNKQAFYVAEAGLQEAIARFDVSDTTSPYWIDTSKGTISPSPWRRSTSTWSKSFKRTDGFSNYSIYLIPTFEDDTYGGTYHTYSSTPNYTDSLVLYNQAFKYPKSPIDGTSNGTLGFPVFHVISVGRVYSPAGKLLASAKIMADITENTINVNAPGALYSGVCLDMSGNYSVNAPGDVAVSTPCTDSLSPYSSHITGTKQTGQPMKNMSSFLGIDIAKIREMATIKFTGGSTETGVNWGNPTTETNPQVIFVDNACKYSGGGCTTGEFRINGNAGYGILVATGDVQITGNFQFKGLVYVLGDFETTGTGAHITGALMVKGVTETDVGGNATINLNRDILEKVSKAGFSSKMITWKEIRE